MDLNVREVAKTWRLRCKLCQAELTTGSLALHLQSQHSVRYCYFGKPIFFVAPHSFEARYMLVEGKWLYPVSAAPARAGGGGVQHDCNLVSHFVSAHHHS